ncbi:CehA/McbA family metallohydrolase [Myxococcota bacterium]|nr:CehA/McbA family metallohydrolase [Myxococcota bacterium]
MSLKLGAVVTVLLLGGATGSLASDAASFLRAQEITEADAPHLMIGGTDSIGGVGDWYLANDLIEIVVDDPSRSHAKQNHGGSIVDAGLIDRQGEDQFARIFTLINLSDRMFPNYDRIEAEVDPAGTFARLVVSNSQGVGVVDTGGRIGWLGSSSLDAQNAQRIRVRTEYLVRPGEPFVRITTTLANVGDEPVGVFAYTDIWMRGGRSMRVWQGNTQQPELSQGFDHPSLADISVFDLGASLVPFDHVVVPGMRGYPPVAYAMFSPTRIADGRVQFGMNSSHVTLVNAFASDAASREIGFGELWRAVRSELLPGAEWNYERRLLITPHSDVASATDRIFPMVGFADGSTRIEGRILPADVPTSIQVDRRDGAPITQIRTIAGGDRAGHYSAIVPPGDYTLTFRSPHRETRTLEVEADGVTRVPDQELEETGWLVFDPPFADGGSGRVIVTGVKGTPDPIFEPELLDFRIGGVRPPSGTEINEIHFLGNDHDPKQVPVSPGHYRLTATRGLEYEIDVEEVQVPTPGESVSVPSFEMRRAVDLPGFTSADFHVHAQASDDSGTSNLSRLRSFVAEDVDVLVSTDHDHVGDFRPALEALDLKDRIVVVGGVEVTSSTPSAAAPWTLGHHNAWPVEHRPLEHRRGAPPSQNLTLPELYDLLREQYAVRVVQLNHPRSSRAEDLEVGAFLSHLGSQGEAFDSTLPIDAPPNAALLETARPGGSRAIDFDAVEVMNGATSSNYPVVRADWYSLLRQGFRITGTANSDTHGPSQVAAYPRNYIEIERDHARRDPSAFDEAVVEGRLFGSNGPLIPDFGARATSPGGGQGMDSGPRASMGELLKAPGGGVEVQFRVASASWIPVDELRLLLNGEVVWHEDLPPTPGRPVDLERRVSLQFEADGILTLEVGAALDADPETWRADHPGPYAEVIIPGAVPRAFTNPIYVDVDGNARFDPPGLEPVPPDRRWMIGVLLFAAVSIWFLRRRRA